VEAVSRLFPPPSELGHVSLFGTAVYYELEPNPVRQENQRKPVA